MASGQPDAESAPPSNMATLKAVVPRRLKADLAGEAMLQGRPMGELAGQLIREGLEARRAKTTTAGG